MTPAEADGLARATLAHALIQLAVHFPTALEELELTPAEALQSALGLAEQAISLAPELPDGHTALGRLILCHDDPEAIEDAIEVLRHALTLDEEHDPAEVALATALHEHGDDDEASTAVERVLKRGNPLPQPLILRAIMQLDRGKVDEARRNIERAVRMAPGAGLFHLDAATAADAAGDRPAAQQHRTQARDLLGDAYESAVRAMSQRDAKTE